MASNEQLMFGAFAAVVIAFFVYEQRVEIMYLRDTVRKLDEKVSELQIRNVGHENQLQHQRKETETVKKAVSDVSEWRKRLDDNTQQIRDLQTTVHSLRQEKDRLSAFRKSVENLESETHTVKKLVDELTLKHKKLDLDLTHISHGLKDHKDKTASFASLTVTADKLDLRTDWLQREMKDVDSKVRRVTSEFEQLKQSLSDFKDKLHQLINRKGSLWDVWDSFTGYLGSFFGSGRRRLN
ncbi:hypothetical protein V1264_000913 [Littorina saxatilis]|uniref:Uncharacterized protein n=1 Tax=Littorina saxatilis TaxID=31220 RepID=A0AAN9C0B4_9CAEN